MLEKRGFRVLCFCCGIALSAWLWWRWRKLVCDPTTHIEHKMRPSDSARRASRSLVLSPGVDQIIPEPAPIMETPHESANGPIKKADDLKRIEGIGPRIATVLEEAGVNTYGQLAVESVERLRHILKDAGVPVANPTTWPEQALLAAADDWVGLKTLQGQLRRGRHV